MNRLQLFRILRRHIKLSGKRSMTFGQNRAAKFVMLLISACTVVYLLMLSVFLSLAANDASSLTSYEFMFVFLPFMLLLDFLLRFIGQHTPSQLVKPYMLLPIPKYACVECFILSNMLSSFGNLLWLFITVPYVIMTMLFSAGPVTSLSFLITFQLLIILNSQWYMAVRTLLNVSLLWWILPAVVYAAVFSPWYFHDIDTLFDTYSFVGSCFAEYNPVAYILLLSAIVLSFFVNRRMQYHFTYIESGNAEKVKPVRAMNLNAFDRFGEMGEYLKLEVKSIIRNKNMRKSFIVAVCCIAGLSLLISFTGFYDDSAMMHDFWLTYTFVIYGAVTLIKIMSAEGNYIDGLMAHKENIFYLLKAKYYFHSIMLIMPFLLMLPVIFIGKCPLLLLVSMLAFTAGPIYCLLMQMAVYNKQTIPLNTKFISKGNIENNYFQIVAEMIALFLPITIITIFKTVFGEVVAYIILLLTGIGFIVFHNLWIRNIYRRFMKRRHINMEAFRSTR